MTVLDYNKLNDRISDSNPKLIDTPQIKNQIKSLNLIKSDWICISKTQLSIFGNKVIVMLTPVQLSIFMSNSADEAGMYDRRVHE